MMKNFLSFSFLLLFATTAFAQDLIVPKEGNPINAFNVEESESYLYYTKDNDSNSQILRIAKSDVLMVRRANGSVMSLDNQKENIVDGTEQQADFPIINENVIHGLLIAEGNCVYIPTDSPYDYEQAGQQKVKEMVKNWGYWTVVNKPEQAHFVLQFTTQTSGNDFSILIIRPRKYYAAFPKVKRDGFWGVWKEGKKHIGVTVNFMKANEDPAENVKNAVVMVEHMKKLITKTEDEESKRFYKYHSMALDADAESNDSSAKMIYAD